MVKRDRFGRLQDGGYKWSEKELAELKRLYIDEDMRLDDVVPILNKKFWHGEEVRNHNTVESKLGTAGYRKREHSSYAAGKITEFHRQILELKSAGYSDRRIANLLDRPVGSVKSAQNYMRKHTMAMEVAMRNAKESTDEKYKNMQTNKELLDQIEALQKENRRMRASTSVVVESIQSVIKSLPPIRPPEIIIKKGMHKPETAILDFGDVHIGEKTVKADAANTTEYSFEKFQERMDALRDGICECIDIQRSKIPIDTLDINALGDIVTGENIYLNQMRSIDRDLTGQLFEGSYNIAEKLILPMAKLFKKVRIRCVWGNHGRPNKPGEFAPKTNFDYISYMFLKQLFDKQTNVEFYIAECPLMLYKIPEAPNFNHLISHGAEINAWMGVPYYGLQRDAGKSVQLFNMPIHYIHMGHFHNRASIDVPYGELILNGNFPGGSELSVFKMKTKSRPKQMLCGFNNARGITWRYDIYLAPLEDLKIDGSGIYTSWNKQKFNVEAVDKSK